MSMHSCLRTGGFGEETWLHSDDTCECNCKYCAEWRRIRALPPIDLNDIRTLWRVWATELTPGPWKATQLQGFGANNYIVTDNPEAEWYQVVAQLENAGSHEGTKYLASCRDGVPRLLTTIENLSKENDELRTKIEKLEEIIDDAHHSALERAERS